jgi:hypothetical protein
MKVKSVGRIDPNTPVTPKGVSPFVTSTGIQIGAFYTPKLPTLSPEEEFWQGVMLGIEPEWSRRRIAQYCTYVITVVAVFFIAFWKAKESLQ